jgi:hypothetical protein
MCAMKNVTLSMDEALLSRASEVARERGTTLNDMVRKLLEREIQSPRPSLEEIFRYIDEHPVKSDRGWTRDELYER